MDDRGQVDVRLEPTAHSQPSEDLLVGMVRRMREAGWDDRAIGAFFEEHPVQDTPLVMERASASP